MRFVPGFLGEPGLAPACTRPSVFRRLQVLPLRLQASEFQSVRGKIEMGTEAAGQDRDAGGRVAIISIKQQPKLLMRTKTGPPTMAL